jgi:hypothetical protein
VRPSTLGHERGDCSPRPGTEQALTEMDGELPAEARNGRQQRTEKWQWQGLTTGRPTHEVELIEDISGGE